MPNSESVISAMFAWTIYLTNFSEVKFCMSSRHSLGAPVSGAAVPRGHRLRAHCIRAPGREAEGRDLVPEGADPGRAVPQREPRGHTTVGDRGLQRGDW